MTEAVQQPIAAVAYVVISEHGDHYIVGTRCAQCGATLLGKRLACAACGTTDAISHIRLASTGRIRACTVINRSYPGVAVPFVAAVIEADGGGVVRGTLRGAFLEDPVAEVGRRVRISIEDTGQRDVSGRPFYSHVFQPLDASK